MNKNNLFIRLKVAALNYGLKRCSFTLCALAMTINAQPEEVKVHSGLEAGQAYAQVNTRVQDRITPDNARDFPPETESGWTPKSGWSYANEAVAAANPLAAEAGFKILRAGGHALDAAISVHMVLGLVEPQSSGIGGGGFLVLSKGGKVLVFDGRETAPFSATEKLFLNTDGSPLDFKTAQLSSGSIGVPGLVAMLWQAHKRYGRLPWHDVMQPAIDLSENGFRVSPRLFQLLKSDPVLAQNPYARAYFYQPDHQPEHQPEHQPDRLPNLAPWPVGYLLKNPELAMVLKDIARSGPKAFYEGLWAKAIVNTVNQPSIRADGSFERDQSLRMSLNDLKNYKPILRRPLCFETSAKAVNSSADDVNSPSKLRVCGVPPPSSGTLAMAQIFGMLEHTPARNLPFGPDWLHYYTEASRLALADRAQYVADFADLDKSDTAKRYEQTWQALISPSYLEQRAQLIGEQKMDSPHFGVPLELATQTSWKNSGSMPDQPEHGTSHVSVIDKEGNAVALTTSIESAFGSKRMVNSGRGRVGGFLLNSELTDFSFKAQDEFGHPIANRPGPGKRPRSSMTPTIVFKLNPPLDLINSKWNDSSSERSNASNKPLNQKLWNPKGQANQPYGTSVYATLGSPGGNAIIHFTSETLWAMLKWGMTPQESINLPHFTLNAPSGTLILEQNLFDDLWLSKLKVRGQTYTQSPLTSGVQAIEKTQSGLLGGADPRREGTVLGR